MHIIHRLTPSLLKLVASLVTLVVLFVPALAVAETTTTPTTSPSARASTSITTSPTTTTSQQHLALIISKGDEEITRRLTQLQKLSSLISSAKHLSTTSKSTLSTEVASEISGLTTLKTKLDSETTLTGASADAQSIFTDYRVYALVTPKVWLIKTADDQQTIEDSLTAFAAKLQSRVTIAKNAGKNVTSLETSLKDMTLQVKNAQTISSSIEIKVLPLQPTDYNADHAVLSGDVAQLKTAHSDNETAYTDAKSIVNGLKSL